MIKVWDFDFNQVPGTASPDYDDRALVQRAFDHNLDLMASLERRGFEGVFYSEHHFVNSMSPCPNLLVAALAMKTQRLKIGVMGNVLPFHQPWRLAEELAMLDYLTHGRLEIGVASGVPPEFLFVGIDQQDIRPMYAEILDILQIAHEQKNVSYSGKHFTLDEVPVMPRARNEDRRRHWMTVYSEASCREAARRDFKVCSGYQLVESAKAAFDGYRDEAASLGRKVGPDDIGMRRQILLAETDAQADELNERLQESMMARMADIFSAVAQRLARGGVGPSEAVMKSGVIDADAVPREQTEQRPEVALKAFVSPDEYINGSPRTVADKIIDQCRRMGAGNIMAYHPNTLDEAQIARNYALWEEVIPILHKADVDLAEVA